MKRALIYCQHVLGMGHLVRSLEIARALHDFQVCFVNGGEPLPEFDLPDSVEVVQLPPLKASSDFTALDGGGADIEMLKGARKALLVQEFDGRQPDVVIIELFPFGRKKFAGELLPFLAHVRLAAPLTKIVCSLRDILVSRDDRERYEAWVVSIMNRYFDLLLVHADPSFQSLDETFSRLPELTAAVKYTGYVVQQDRAQTIADDAAPTRASAEPTILVSVGGGRVGAALLQAAIGASARLMPSLPHRMKIFSGPYLPEECFGALRALAAPQRQISLRRYTPRFLRHMAQADLSLSMAGYNTCMNVLTTGTRALLWPFTGDGDDEQPRRAKKLAELGVVGVLSDDELTPEGLARRMVEMLGTLPRKIEIDTGGARNTQQVISECIEPAKKTVWRPIGRARDEFCLFEKPLAAALAKLEQDGRAREIFLRDDDVDVDEPGLRRLLDLSLSYDVSLNLEIIPARLSGDAARLLLDHQRFAPGRVEAHQHGWRHISHETAGKKCEFGAARSYDEQLRDLARGKARSTEALGELFFPAFTPPWNRCSEATYRALDQLGFKVLSRDANGLVGYGFREIPVTLDLLRSRDDGQSPHQACFERLLEQLTTRRPIGIMLHHKVMGKSAFRWLEFLLDHLAGSPAVSFHTFSSLAAVQRE